MPEFATVIVSYNTRIPLKECIASALQEGAEPVVVVDNASSDGTAAMVRTAFPRVLLHANQTNRGYGAAANQGIASCSAPYVMVLNGDARLAPGALRALARRFDEHPEVAVVGPRLLNLDGSLQPSCYAFPGSLKWVFDNDVSSGLTRRLPFLRDRLLRVWRHDRERAVPWVKGAALAIRRRAFEAVGGFDESFSLDDEEADLCRRLTAAGWRVLFTPSAAVHHIHGASTGNRGAPLSLQLFAGQVQYFRAHCPRTKALWTAMLKAIELYRQICDRLRLPFTRGTSARAALAERIAIRERKIRLDPRRAGEVWRMIQHEASSRSSRP